MFAGSTLANVTAMVKATVDDIVVAGATVAGYLLGRAWPNTRVPPLALALVTGAVAILITHRATPAPIQWALPTLVMPEMRFTLNAFVAVTLPLVILSLGLGNVQGLGFLLAQGYKVPVNVITVLLGGLSSINALFGGHQAIVARAGAAMLASPEAGPSEGRYWANVVSGGLTFVTAFAATPLASMLGIVPTSFVVTLAGLAILASFQESLVRAVSERFRFGSLVAFLLAATPFDVAGITSAFWALLVGVAVSALVERQDFARP
jgi:benzoate membrane transport protein